MLQQAPLDGHLERAPRVVEATGEVQRPRLPVEAPSVPDVVGHDHSHAVAVFEKSASRSVASSASAAAVQLGEVVAVVVDEVEDLVVGDDR